MQINTKYSIGDKVKVKCLIEEFVPITSAHIVETTGIIDSIQISRNGISYSIFIENKDISPRETEIVELIAKEEPKKITSFQHFFHLDHYSSISLISKDTKEEYSRFAFGGDNKTPLVSLYHVDKTKEDVIVKESKLKDKYDFKVDFSRELTGDLSLEDSEVWEVEEMSFKERFVITSDDIDRYCYLYDCIKIKKIEVNSVEML